MADSDSEVIVRPYDPASDLDGLRACVIAQQDFHRHLEPSWPEGSAIIDDYLRYLERQCAVHNGRIAVAERHGAIVGFVCVVASTQNDAPDDPAAFAWIHDIFVSPVHRRHGVATRLMSEAESFARANGARLLRLGVLARNDAARAFYAGLGFREYVCVMSRSLD